MLMGLRLVFRIKFMENYYSNLSIRVHIFKDLTLEQVMLKIKKVSQVNRKPLLTTSYE